MTLIGVGTVGPRQKLLAIGLALGGLILATGSVFAGDPQCSSGGFHNPEFAAGEGACAAALGDVNGDSDVDAIVINRYEDNVSVLLNNGDRTLADQVTYSVGQDPWSVVLVDLDDDGDLDLAVSNRADDTVSVLSNDGNANFTSDGTYAVGNFPSQLASGNLDDDENPDLAVVNAADNTVSILLNNGDGTFAAQVAVATGVDPRSLVIADLDGDTALDITTGNWNTNNVSVLLNNGQGSFGAPLSFGAGNRPMCITAGDLDGDGDEDLAVGNYFGNDFLILINNGSASFSAAGFYPAGTGRPMAATVADLDEDGDLDIVAPSQNSETVAVLWNDGAASFATEIVDGASASPTGIAVGDLDGDSHLDITVANFFGYNLSVIFGRGDGTLGTNQALATGPGPREVVLDDLDGDGNLDIAGATFTTNPEIAGGHAIALYMGSGDGTFADAVFHPCNLSSNGPQAIASGDLDDDGSPDLAIAYETGLSVGVMLNNGDGTFGPDVPYGHYLDIEGVWANDVALGDLDGDEDLDLVSAGLHISVSFNHGDGTFTDEVAYEPFLSTYSIQLEDVDGDDDLDIAAASQLGPFEEGLLIIRLNNGSGTFGEPTSYPAGLSPSSIAFGDIDGDGTREVLVANWFSGDQGPPHVSIMEKDANGDYYLAYTVGADMRCRFASLADLDLDGDLDVVVSNNVGDNVSVALNHGDGTFAETVQYGAGDGNWSHAVGDVNGDGLPDIVTADYLADTISVLPSECAFCGNGIVDPGEECDGDPCCAANCTFQTPGTALCSGDQDFDGIRDDSCTFLMSCGNNSCMEFDTVFADIGGANGNCLPDGAADGNDRFHALNCFSDQNTLGAAGYPCEPNPPAAVNADAGGPLGACCPDGVCDGNDAFHAINSFSGENPCQCPANFVCPPGPAPAPPGGSDGARVTAVAQLRLTATRETIRPGDTVEVIVVLDSALPDLRGYQLHAGITGGDAGGLDMVDLSIEQRNHVFAGLPDWRAFNVHTQQALAGIDAAGIRTRPGAYLATLTLRASKDAAGTFAIDLLHDNTDPAQRTFLFATPAEGRILVTSVTPAVVTIESGRAR
jgi:hypothetical protein